MNEEVDKLLQKLVGKEIEIAVVHHVEGVHLRTNGILKEASENFIKIEIEYKDHWWQRKKKGLYICNRKASSLLSIFIFEVD